MGQYRAGLQALRGNDDRKETPRAQLLRAELLARVGDCEKATRILEGLQKLRNLPDLEKSHLEYIRSFIAVENGWFEEELQHLQKSIYYAERAGDLERTCWAQFWLACHLADKPGPDAVEGLVADIRKNATKLAEPRITAALHVLVALVDGKRGLLDAALHHTRLAHKLLKSAPHLWIQAMGHINLMAISILRCELDEALMNGEAALATSVECGAARLIRSCLGNLGHIQLIKGDFEKAVQHFENVLAMSPGCNENVFLARESIAQVHLAQRHPEAALNFVNEPDESAFGVGRYTHRNAQLTKARILGSLGQWNESDQFIARALRLAREAADPVLIAIASLFHAEVLIHCGHREEALKLVGIVLPTLPKCPPDMLARYERVLACALLATGDLRNSQSHRERAERILCGLQNRSELAELSHSWDQAQKLGTTNTVSQSDPTPRRAGNLLQNVATLALHTGRPNLLATGLVAILKDAECAIAALAVARGESGEREELASFGTIPTQAATRTFTLGTARNRTVEVTVAPRADIESQATLNAVTILLGTIHDLERAQAEREERLTLWPIDEPPFEGDDSVIAGRMRELMANARKVARTNVTVLVTGESGTGKEVLARAIHGFSARAKKPFVPFNCTAVPRELLESQLFGYRRGAFTGAERDHAGLIRSARDGTLFLDEVGELGLDLQPKLLRFLESGEINPLGETSPLTVDVRIVAATNANLERLVEEGRFREDLFYRLNVIYLSIPPLRERRDEIPGLVHHFVAKAAGEFHKGRVRVAEETMERLLLYTWPGNVRQLQNELRRMVALADVDSTLTPSTLSKTIRQETMRVGSNGHGPELAVSLTEKLTPTLLRIEREMIKTALRANQGRAEATARALGISRKGLYLKRQRLGV